MVTTARTYTTTVEAAAASARPVDPGLLTRRSWVYVLCMLDAPRPLAQADWPGPLAHYVGITRQVPPWLRIRQHGPSAELGPRLVALMLGDEVDEEQLKRTGTCPGCGEPLEYRLGLGRDAHGPDCPALAGRACAGCHA